MMQKAFAKDMDEDMAYSSDTSKWSSPFGSYSSECEDQADAIPSVKVQGSKQSGRILFGKKAQRGRMQKTNPTTNRHTVVLPPINSLEPPKPSWNLISELKNKVSSLQKQLCESRTENKLLKGVQHRHTVALQHYQDSEKSISQIVTKHKNEARVLQHCLRDTRISRDKLARQLRNTEYNLLQTKATLQHLQLLNEKHSLLEREELTQKLAKASSDLKEKNKKILDMEKNFELCQASFKRQIVTEQKKLKEAKKISTHLQEQINQLTRELACRDREMEKRNIYSHRFQNASSNKGRENKMVQKNGLVLLPVGPAILLEDEYSEPVQRLKRQESSVKRGGYSPAQEPLVKKHLKREAPANLSLEENHQDDARISANCSKINSSDSSPEPLNKGDCVKVKEKAKPTHALVATQTKVKYLLSDTCADESPENEKKRQTKHESTMAFTLENSLKLVPQTRTESRNIRIRNIPRFHLPDRKTDGGEAHSSNFE